MAMYSPSESCHYNGFSKEILLCARSGGPHLDQILDPINDRQRAVLVPLSDVTRFEPPIRCKGLTKGENLVSARPAQPLSQSDRRGLTSLSRSGRLK